jgi:phosphopantetheine adenylyltransferase
MYKYVLLDADNTLLDFDKAEEISIANTFIHFGIDTCYFRAGNLGYVSSSLVMELWNNGANVSNFVPPAVEELLKK